MDESLEKKLKDVEARAIERNKHREIEMFTTENGYSAIFTAEDDGSKTLSLDNEGYLSKFDLTPEGPIFLDLADYKGVMINTDSERIIKYTQEAQAVFNQLKDDGKI